MPIIRSEVQTYARIWNIHRIRRQPNRPNCVSGQPIMLYNCPERTGAQEHGLNVDEELVAGLREQVSGFGMFLITTLISTKYSNNIQDIDEYLPPVTKEWCRAELQQLGYGSGRLTAAECFPDGSRAHCQAYLQLRARIHQHLASGQEPELKESERPTGAWDWIPQAEHVEDPAVNEGIDIYQEGDSEDDSEDENADVGDLIVE